MADGVFKDVHANQFLAQSNSSNIDKDTAELIINQVGAGDPLLGFQVGTTANVIMGIDNSSSDHFRIRHTAENFAANGSGFYLDSGNRVAIGGNPDTTALLTLTSTTTGFLPPRMTTAQRDAISNPAQGLMLFNTTTSKLNFYSGAGWEAVTSA